MEILPGVYLAAQKSNLDLLVEQDKHRYRVYLGHSAGVVVNSRANWSKAPG